MTAERRPPAPRPDASRRWAAAGIVLGVGIGGLMDAMVLHEILQWHHYVSAHTPPTDLAALQLNVFVDGLFLAFAVAATVAGSALLWRAMPTGPRPGTGAMVTAVIVGWSALNVVDGVVNHQLLGLHHVREGPDALAWDVAFLVASTAVLVVSALRLRAALREGGARS